MKVMKLKKSQQRGGVKTSVQTTGGKFVPTVDSDLIIPLLFSNCDKSDLLSTGSSGFAFVMHLKPGSTIHLRSQTLDATGNPLSQLDAADRSRSVDIGMPMEKFCVKISLVKTGTTDKHGLEYDGVVKRGVTLKDATEEVENQRLMHEASMCATGVHGVFIPDAISHRIMDPTNFNLLVTSLSGVVTAASQRALAWIQYNAVNHHYHIHVFCMELIGSVGVGSVVAGGPAFTTFNAFCRAVAVAEPGINFPQAADDIACKIAAAVISTFTKSSFWSYDSHSNNIMTNGIIAFLLDLGRLYHIRISDVRIKLLLRELLTPEYKIHLACFFGLSAGYTNDTIKSAFSAIYNRYMDPDRLTIAALFTIDPAVPGDNLRVRSNIFEILALFALIDGMTNHNVYKTGGFQCVEYMHRVFHTRSTFSDLSSFLSQCSSTLTGFEAVCDARAGKVPGAGGIIGSVITNLDAIAHLLQGALVPCAAMGLARTMGQFRLPKPDDPLSPEEFKHRWEQIQQAETERQLAQAKTDQAELDRIRETQRQEEQAAIKALFEFVGPPSTLSRDSMRSTKPGTKTPVVPLIQKPPTNTNPRGSRPSLGGQKTKTVSTPKRRRTSGKRRAQNQNRQRTRRQRHIYRTSRSRSRGRSNSRRRRRRRTQ